MKRLAALLLAILFALDAGARDSDPSESIYRLDAHLVDQAGRAQ